MCCDFLAKSFNFTSSICRLLLTNFNKSNMKDSESTKKMVLSEKNVKIAFHVLNKLTSNNKLFGIDAYVKQFVYYIVNKM